MTVVEVWAPDASKVEIVGPDARMAMDAAGDGWFRAEIDFADYSFALDGGEPRPDPRSRWQPEGVHGPSRVYDDSAFGWTDSSWRGFPLSEAVVYELHVGTFTPEGTFDAAIERLDHLASLGVNAVELMPVNEFPGGRGWGYDGVDLYAAHHAYGGPDGLKRLVDACHARALAVIVDVVYNHLGPAGNYLREFGPYFTDSYNTPWGDAVNFDGAGSDEVRRFFIDNALMWLRDYHFDGLRLDAVHAIFDRSAVHFLEELADRVRDLGSEVGRTLWVIAESDLNDPQLVWAKERGGYGLDAQWSDDFHHALHACLTRENAGYYADFGRVADIAKAIEETFVYDGCHSRFRGRKHGRPAADVPAQRFLGYLQDHDQVGNRAIGERTSALLSPGLLKLGAALVLTSPFLYFTDHDDPQLGRAVSEGRKGEFAAFGWDPDEIPDPQAPETFESSKLRWAELDDPHHADLLEWHRTLIALRKQEPALHAGRRDLTVEHSEDPPWLVVHRDEISIAANVSVDEADVPFTGDAELVLSSGKDPSLGDGVLRLPGETIAIFRHA